jgi:hypothetical protein
VICLEARQVSAALAAMRNKTDRNDARGIALARKLAVILHKMWINGTDFRWAGAEAAS